MRQMGHTTKCFSLAGTGREFTTLPKKNTEKKAWDAYWAMLDGDGDLVWGPDPELTPLGKQQALMASNEWKSELSYGIPLPQKLYCSPMTRALDTNRITFDGILTDESRRTIIMENCRETYGEHTCDKRKTRTSIAASFPRFEIEEGFSEQDNLWTPERESDGHVAFRARKVLDHIFSHDRESFFSITGHGGIINGFLESVGRAPYELPTGGVIPVIIKASGF